MKLAPKKIKANNRKVLLAGSIFLLSSTLVFAATTTINTDVTNVIQYIQSIIATDNGGSNGTAGVTIDGPNAKVSSNQYCDQTGNNCVSTANIFDSEAEVDAAISNNGYLTSYTETDPTYSANIGNYYTKTQADSTFLTSYSESDPIFFTGTDGDICTFSGTQIWCTTDSSGLGGGGTWSQSGSDIYYSGGNIGIGTENPQADLNIYKGTDGQSVLLQGAGDPVGIAQGVVGGSNTLELTTADTVGSQATRILIRGGTDNADIEFYGGSGGYETLNMFLNSEDGNLGLGTNTPSEKLDVNGNILANGKITVDGARPVTINTSSPYGINIKGDTGGRAMGYEFLGSSNTNLGGFSARGTADGLDRYYIGEYLSDEKVSILNDGKVGIGTISPDGTLDVTSTGTAELYLQTSATSSQDATLHIAGARTTSTTTDISSISFETNDSDSAGKELAKIAARKETTSTNEGNLLFFTTPSNGGTLSEAMRIDKSGNLGIGNSDPAYPLDIKASSNNQDLLRLSHPTSPTDAGFMIGFNTDGTINDNVISLGVEYSATDYDVINIQRSTRNVGIGVSDPEEALEVNGTIRTDNGNGYGEISAVNTSHLHYITDRPDHYFNKSIEVNGGINVYSSQYGISSAGDATFNQAEIEGNLTLSDGAPEIIIDNADYKRITANDGGGNFNIRANSVYNGGEKYADAGGATHIRMDADSANGAMYFKVANIGSAGGAITWASTMTLNNAGLTIDNSVTADEYYYNSDRRLKTNIKAIDNSIEKLLQLNGYNFDWKDDGKHAAGLIAQEVEEVFPEMVKTNDEGYKSVQYGNLVAPIIEAIKELYHKVVQNTDQNTKQEQEIQLLKEQINSLQKEIESLKNKQ